MDDENHWDHYTFGVNFHHDWARGSNSWTPLGLELRGREKGNKCLSLFCAHPTFCPSYRMHVEHWEACSDYLGRLGTQDFYYFLHHWNWHYYWNVFGEVLCSEEEWHTGSDLRRFLRLGTNVYSFDTEVLE